MRTAVAALAFFLVAGCDAMVVSPTLPSSPTIASPVATAEPPAELDEWIAFREWFGLRADRGWVLQVANDPASTTDAGIVACLRGPGLAELEAALLAFLERAAS